MAFAHVFAITAFAQSTAPPLITLEKIWAKHYHLGVWA